MYSVGDAVFHPTNGAGIITKVERMPAILKELKFYQIRMLGKNDTVLRVPVTKADELGLRPALSEEEVGQILDILSGQPEELPELHKARYKECQDRLDTGDTRIIAALVRDLAWRRVVADKLNAPGHRIFKSAIWLLAGELAVSQDTTVQAGEEQIHDALKRATQPV
jgi:CarD family transcriptional regulator, regulator of rRNA transcription